MTSPRYLIIHGHFYQPPRENPWSGSISQQISAAPFPNWNERINRECYAPNARARLLNSKTGSIAKIINNYEYLSFNIGPTLLLWLKDHDPETYKLVLAADQTAARRHHGHGPALAQVFNHVILPLANSRDQLTQAIWGLSHFRSAFGREPEGMWLAETAADLESLAILAKVGLKFTVLAQNQIKAVRPLTKGRDEPWTDLTASPDPREPYRIFWGQGANDYLDVFVYDGPVSRAVAFERLLRDGSVFLERLKQAFGAETPNYPRLVNLATDGESYGHHFHFGDMTLAWLFNALDNQPPDDPNPIKLTNYGEYLALYPPRFEAKLVDNSSWSCCHGVERWRADCGCATGSNPNWNQKWRTPLRDGLNWLRDQLALIFEAEGRPLLKDPWAARDAYIAVTLADYDERVRTDFLARETTNAPTAAESQKIIRLLEAQRMGLYMFTSCAWFFDDLAGLEPVQNLRYAARAIALTQDLAKTDLTEGLLTFLRKAIPNDQRYKTGEDVWRDLVAAVDLKPGQAAAHAAAAEVLAAPQALDEFTFLKRTVKAKTLVDGQYHLLAGQAIIRDIRLEEDVASPVLALLGPGHKLDVLVGLADEDFESEAPAIWTQKGAAALTEDLAFAWPYALRFGLENLWPSVRRILSQVEAKEFFEDIISYVRKAYEGSREFLGRYRQPDAPETWLESFIFRVMAEADLELFAKTMEEGGSVDLDRLVDLVQRESALESDNTRLIRRAVEDYLLKLLELLPEKPRPTLLAELLKLTQIIALYLPQADLWASQNRFNQLAGELAYARELNPNELALFFKIGENLGFGPYAL